MTGELQECVFAGALHQPYYPLVLHLSETLLNRSADYSLLQEIALALQCEIMKMHGGS